MNLDHNSKRKVLRDKRFEQLYALAEAGDENAAADLFKEFDYKIDGNEEGAGDDTH